MSRELKLRCQIRLLERDLERQEVDVKELRAD